jgi:hypothetical protein
MAAPTRFPAGVSTNAVNTIKGNLPYPDPLDVIHYENDFHTYAAGDWTVNAGGGGSGNALGTGAGGFLVLTAATSGVQSILGNPSFAFNPATSQVAGSQFWFSCNFIQTATVANPDYQIGLMKGTLSSALNETDGVYFWKKTGAVVDSTDTSWNLVIKANAASTSVIRLPGVLPTNSATIQLGFYYDGKPTPTMYVYANGNIVGTVGANGTLSTTGLANLPGTAVLMGIGALNGFNTGTSQMSIDYVQAAVETTRN